MNAINRHSMRRYLPWCVAALLTACGGDDGKPGNPGEPGGPPASEIAQLVVEVNEVQLNNNIATINYRVTNEDDEPVVGIPSSTYIASQLLPQGYTNAGNSSQWQYFTSESCSPDCPGEFVDHRNGQYSYTFSGTFDGMNDVSYIAGSTQRLVIKIGGDNLPDGTPLPITNQHYDWQDNGMVAYTRNIVTIETCNTCHNDLAFHGSKYNEIETCVTCHTEGRVSNNDNIFPQMVHSKHLQGYPGSLADCQTCHAEDETLTEHLNWARVPTMEACGSCHTSIDFPAGEGHPAQADNSNCVACHNADWTMSAHNDGGNDEALAQFNAQITQASLAGTTVNFTVRLSNPQTGSVYSDSADKLNFISDLRVYANWGNSFDYATRSAKSIKLNETSPSSGSNGEYSYMITDLAVPAGSELDTGTLAIQGRLCAANGQLGDCGDESFSTVNIKSSYQFFNAEMIADMGRRSVVTNETCGSCHGDQALNYHGSRNDLEQQCQLCHNPNMAADSQASNPSIATADYKHMIHSIHNGQREGYESINYPGNIGNCAQCHAETDNGGLTAALPLFEGVPPLMLDNGTYTSATTAICSDCHTSDSAKGHMTQQGGVFMGTFEDATAGTESCATCHGQGSSVDVLKVHPIN
ncbi:OmcA/MtrC family decaheme c-type cytochrome [Shewanella waksmanii]|uniref:OmcA/MtrC family decaheme c-type cytochrome n=1 Tax=Shewanella waksmanii TaxID=213783 RepID=UPI0037367D81